MSMYTDVMCNYKNIKNAYRLAHAQKTDDQTVIAFDENRSYNLHKLQEKLRNKQWDDIFHYYRFVIHEPKRRVVDALEFEGRIVLHILCDNILAPYLDKRLVSGNSACRLGKGTDYAVNLLKAGLVEFFKHHETGYAVKADVKGYFPHIDRKILKSLFADFPDEEIRELIYYIIDHAPGENGIPIGNQSSQWFALVYFDRIDRIIKEKYGISGFVRYMDDFIFFHESIAFLHVILDDIRFVAYTERHLEYNGKTQIIPLHKGINFLGWKLIPVENNHIVMKLDPSKKQYRKKKVKEIKNEYAHGEITAEKYKERIGAVKANLDKGDTFQLQKSLGIHRMSIRNKNKKHKQKLAKVS